MQKILDYIDYLIITIDINLEVTIPADKATLLAHLHNLRDMVVEVINAQRDSED